MVTAVLAAALGAGVLLGPALEAATRPKLYAILEARGALSAQPAVVVSGSRLNVFHTFSLIALSAQTLLEAPRKITARPDFIVGGRA